MMTKLPIVFLVGAFVAQVSLLHGITQFDYLNRLHKNSQFKHNCEGVSRGWTRWTKGQLEDACDTWDNEFKRVSELSKAVALCEHQKDRDALFIKFNEESHKNVGKLKNAMNVILPYETVEVIKQEELFIEQLAQKVYNEAQSKN